MFEYIKEQDDINVKLNKEQKEKIAQHIGYLFSEWDSVRSKQKNIADLLRAEIYLDERKRI